MKLSIITVCYNSAATIRDAVESVLSQIGVELEYIVIDGGSTDGTLDILKGYGDQITRLVSEPDEGIYDAMNKGVSLATGDVVGILNSDDYYPHAQVLGRVMAVFQGGQAATDALNPNLTLNPNLERARSAGSGAGASPSAVGQAQGRRSSGQASRAPMELDGNDGSGAASEINHQPSAINQGSFAAPIDCVFGDLDYVDAEDTTRVIRAWRSKPYVPGAFKRGWHPAHPTFFVKRSAYERFGLFDTTLKIAADYEFMLRILEREKLSSAYLPEVIVKMRMGGASNASLGNVLKANLQCWKAWRQNGLGWSPLPVIAKPLSKLKQLRARRAI